MAVMATASEFIRTTDEDVREFITAGGTLSLDAVMVQTREGS